MNGVPGGLFPVPLLRPIQISGVEVHPAEHGIDVGEKPHLIGFLKPVPQQLQGPAGVVWPALGKIVPGQQTTGGKLNIRCSPALDFSHVGDQGQHPLGYILALFKLALGQGAVRQAHPIGSQQLFHRQPDGIVEKIILGTPCGKILAAVHNAGQAAGNGEWGQTDFLVRQQSGYGGDGFCQPVGSPLGQGDVQPGHPAPGLPSGGIPAAARTGKVFQCLIPAFRTLVVHGQGAEHTHALHQGRGVQNLLLRQGSVILFHFAVVAHAGVHLGIADQQLRHLGKVPAPAVAFQGMGIVLFQLIIQPAPAEQGPALFLGIPAPHLPEQKALEMV